MSDGERTLDVWIEKLKRLRRIGVRAAEIARPLLEEEAKRTAREGTSPDGKPWAPLKYSGGRALVKAADFVSAKQVGTVVALVLKGPYVLHNFGTGHAEKRQILPSRGVALPPRIRAICAEASRKAFREVMG